MSTLQMTPSKPRDIYRALVAEASKCSFCHPTNPGVVCTSTLASKKEPKVEQIDPHGIQFWKLYNLLKNNGSFQTPRYISSTGSRG